MKPKSDKTNYRGYPERLHHEVPHWVEAGSIFHIRIAINREKQRMPLSATHLAQALVESARIYHASRRWHITLFLLMPDHLHALLSFPIGNAMSRPSVIGNIFKLTHMASCGRKVFRSSLAK
jgi:REP element-mobilizing transposase RayT